MSGISAKLLILLLTISLVQANIFQNRYTAEFSNSKYLTYVITGVAVAIGLVVAFCGYRLFKPVLFIVGFIIFAGITYLILWSHSSVGVLVLVVCTVVAGIVGGIVMLFVVKVGIFMLGASAGFILFCVVMSVRNQGLIHEPIAIYVGMCASFVIGGVIALLVQKPLIIFATAFGGSYAVIAGIDRYVQGGFCQVIPHLIANHRELINADYKTYIEIAACVVLTVAGLYVQFKHTGKNVYHSHTSEPSPEADGYYRIK